jgi:aminoglycoside phosphotransferase (APT) family kinase protein
VLLYPLVAAQDIETEKDTGVPTLDARNLNTDVAEKLARTGLRLNGQPLSIVPVGAGQFSTSWFVWVEGPPHAGEYVLRVAPPDDAGFLFYEYRMMRQEPALHRLVRRRTGIPVPRIVAYDFSRTRIDCDWLIMERLSGEPLLKVQPRLMARQLHAILVDLGRHTAALHRIRSRLFGYRGPHEPMPPQRTWADAFAIMWSKLIEDVRATDLYSPALCDLAASLFPRHRCVFEGNLPACLCHMDLWSENVLVHKGQLSGLIDFDRACWAEPGIDLAIAEYCGLTRSPFWTGYGSRPEPTEPFLLRRWFYLMYEHQKYIVIHAARRDDLARARDYAADCRTMLEQFASTADPTTWPINF